MLIMLFFSSACSWLCEPRALSPPQPLPMLTLQAGDFLWYISPSLLPLWPQGFFFHRFLVVVDVGFFSRSLLPLTSSGCHAVMGNVLILTSPVC